MGMSGFGAAGQNYVNQRAGNQSGATQFLKLDSAFKQAIMLQKMKDMEEGRRLQYTTETETAEGKANRTSAKEIATQGNITDITKASITANGKDIDVIKTIMAKVAQNGFSVLNPGERALYDDYSFKNMAEKFGMAVLDKDRPSSTGKYDSATDGGDLNAKAEAFLKSINQLIVPENIKWVIDQGLVK